MGSGVLSPAISRVTEVTAVGGHLIRPAALRDRQSACIARAGNAQSIAALSAAEVFSGTEVLPGPAFHAVVDAADRPETRAAVHDGGRFLSLPPFAVPEAEWPVGVGTCGVQTEGTPSGTRARPVEAGHLTL